MFIKWFISTNTSKVTNSLQTVRILWFEICDWCTFTHREWDWMHPGLYTQNTLSIVNLRKGPSVWYGTFFLNLDLFVTF